jgi:uncharacterized membrane protein YbaN (DUF454 family)
MKIIYLTLGLTSLGLGAIGVILPILPTTPFFILATFMFSKSSDKINDKLKNSKIYNKHFADFIENKTMSKKKKWTLLIIVDLMLLITFIRLDNSILRVVLIALFLIKHWYFYKFIKTI